MHIHNKASKFFSLVLSVAIMFAAAFVLSPSASAVSYEGKGTKKSPYIVKTAEQLKGMADKPSAYYKLGNTIELSQSGNFTPIGYLAKPFKGTFTCDLGTDGAPLYAIKNLTILNDAGTKNGHAFESNNYPDYSENNSHWESALFGATDGATFKNIYVLNAKVTNTVIGQHKQNANGTWNPGQDEMATAILVGIAKNTNISGCFVSGTVDAKTNSVGALAGLLRNGSLKNSAAEGTIGSVGYYNIGGLVGMIEASTIDKCYFNGTANAPASPNNSGAAFGMADTDSKISNCYSEGSLTAGSGFIGVTDYEKLGKIVSNCYTLSKIVGRTNAPTNKNSVNNCYVLSEAGCLQMGFGAASAAEILQKFSGLEGWITSGVTAPKLKDSPVIKSADAYSPNAVTETPANNTDNKTTASDTDNTVSDSTEDTDTDTVNNAKKSEANITVKNTRNQAETILIVIISVLIVLVLAATVVMIVLVIKMTKNNKTGNEGKGDEEIEAAGK